MNIAIISPEFPPYTNWGGIATFNENLAHLVISLGHNVDVLTYAGIGKSRRVKRDKFIIHYISFEENGSRLLNFYSKIRWLLYFFLKRLLSQTLFTLDWNIYSYAYFKQLHKKQKIDVVHSDSYHCSGWLISRVYNRILHISHLHGPRLIFNKFEPFTYDNYLSGYLEKLYLVSAPSIVITSSKHLHDWSTKMHFIKKHSSIYIPNFLDSRIFENKSPLSIDRLVFLGRIEYRKGADLVLEAFIRLAKKDKNIKIWFIGTQRPNFPKGDKFVSLNQLKIYTKLHKNIKKRIILVPPINERSALFQKLKTLRGIAILPSRYEPFGYTMAEMMAMGYLVVTIKNTFGTKVVKNNINGFVVNQNKVPLWKTINKIRSMSNTKQQSIAQSAVKTVKMDYDIRNKGIMASYRKIYSDLV